MSGWSGRVGWVGGWLLRLGGLACPTCPRMLSLPIPPPLHPPPRPSPMQPPPSGQALLLVAEAQLTLLLRLAMAGPPLHRAASAQRLLSLHALPRLAQCRALGLQPEEPGFAQYTGVRGAGGGVAGCAWGVGSGVGWGVRGRGSAASSASRHHPHARTSPTPAPPSPHSPPPHPRSRSPAGQSSLRARLHLVVPPLLRLVLAVATALPTSATAREQAAAFVDTHARALVRVMHDAASPGVR